MKKSMIIFIAIAMSVALVSCKKNSDTEVTDALPAPVSDEGKEENTELISEEKEAAEKSDTQDVVIFDGFELCTTDGRGDSAGHYMTDNSFSEGLAWSGYYDDEGDRYIGIIDEDGRLIFAEEMDKLSKFMGHSTFHNTLFEDGVAALYNGDSFIIVDNTGNILCAAISTEHTSYHLMGYGDGIFPVIKTVRDILGEESEYLYGIDRTGKLVSTPSVWQEGYSSAQHASYVGDGVFTDGISMFDLNSHENYYFDGHIEYSLEDWASIPEKLDIPEELDAGDGTLRVYRNYPLMRAYGYYGSSWGYKIRENVYENTDRGMVETHYRFYNTDGSLICDIPDTIQGKEVKRVGLYSGGYVPVELADEDDEYITVLDVNGIPIYEPVSESENNIYGWDEESSYMGYTAVSVSPDECSLTIITPKGEFKKMGDDLSELGKDAYMYTRSGCFIANGYMSDMNLDGGGGLAYVTGDETLYNVYVSLDGKKVIKGATTTATTKSLQQDIEMIADENVDSTTVLKNSLSKSSLKYDNELAKILALMSDKSEEAQPDEIIKVYQMYGLSDIQDDNYGSSFVGGGASVIGRMKLLIDGTPTDVLVITCRGSVTMEEFIGDWLKGPDVNRTDPESQLVEFEGEQVFDNVNDMADKVWAALDKYIGKYPELKNSDNLKIVVNGHSLGGACASMIAAKLDNQAAEGSLFNKKVSRENVYAYTFGGIEVFEEDTNVSQGYENIHNLYNRYDTFGPEGNLGFLGASASNAKFGHTEGFELDLGNGLLDSTNHQMSTYRSALEMDSIYNGFISSCGR